MNERERSKEALIGSNGPAGLLPPCGRDSNSRRTCRATSAIRIVRDSATVWGINPRDVGIMGFSAGGHLASTVSTHSTPDCRPDFSILFYPVVSMNEHDSHKGSCVGFLGQEGMKDE